MNILVIALVIIAHLFYKNQVSTTRDCRWY
jgi:hypothetical protein